MDGTNTIPTSSRRSPDGDKHACMNELGFQLQLSEQEASVIDPALLSARPALEAYQALDDWLLRPQDLVAARLVSFGLKMQFLPALANLRWSENSQWVRLYSLESLATGLLCGGIDGLALYRQAERPLDHESPPGLEQLVANLVQAIEVANTDWRALEEDELHMQAAYGKHLNRNTDQENVEFLSRPGSGDVQARRAMGETFRTGYSLGLIDAAIVVLHGQTPDRLQ